MGDSKYKKSKDRSFQIFNEQFERKEIEKALKILDEVEIKVERRKK